MGASPPCSAGPAMPPRPPFLLSLLFALACCAPLARGAAPAPVSSSAAPTPTAHPQVLLHTSLGDITVELFPDKAPHTVANFLQYVQDGFYDGTVFHRVVAGYLVQGGLYTRQLTAKRTRPPVQNEANNGLSNLRGTLAAARGADPDSATSQFFFNVVDNPRLDYIGNQSGQTWGYAVFGKVVAGMDVVDKIDALPTGPQGPFVGDVPRPLVVIESAKLAGDAAKPAVEPLAPTGGAAPYTPTTKPGKHKSGAAGGH